MVPKGCMIVHMAQRDGSPCNSNIEVPKQQYHGMVLRGGCSTTGTSGQLFTILFAHCHRLPNCITAYIPLALCLEPWCGLLARLASLQSLKVRQSWWLLLQLLTARFAGVLALFVLLPAGPPGMNGTNGAQGAPGG